MEIHQNLDTIANKIDDFGHILETKTDEAYLMSSLHDKVSYCDFDQLQN